MVTAILRNVTDGDVGSVVQGESEWVVVGLAMDSLVERFRKVGPVDTTARRTPTAIAVFVDPNGQVWEVVRVELIR